MNSNQDELPDELTQEDLEGFGTSFDPEDPSYIPLGQLLGQTTQVETPPAPTLNDPAFLDLWYQDNQSSEPKWALYEKTGALHRPTIARRAQELNQQHADRGVTFRPKLRNFDPITLTHEPYDDPYQSWLPEEESHVDTDETYGPNLTEEEENTLYYRRHCSLELAQEDEEVLNRWMEG